MPALAETPPRSPAAGGDRRDALDRLAAVVVSFLPGLLAGAQLSGLLLFLNPALPLTWRTLTRGILFYGTLLGLVSALILLPFTWRRPQLARRILPWALTVVLAVSAAVDWIHAAHYAYLLPPGINERLLKTGLWLSLGALIFFYTALLHTLHARPYGKRSRIGLTAVALVSLLVPAERRDAYRPPAPVPRASALELSLRSSLVVVGIDQLTLSAILPLAEQGRLPFLATLIQEGAYGHLETFSPVRQAPQWTTLATGKLPYKHGIVDDWSYSGIMLASHARLHLIPAGLGFAAWGTPGEPRAVDGDSRRALTIWEILSRQGVATGVVGWPGSYPVSDGSSFAFSDRYFDGDASELAARPPELAERGQLFHLDAGGLDPGLADRFGDDLPEAVTTAILADLWRESLTYFLLDQRSDVRTIFLMLPGLSEVSERYFGAFSAVEFDGIQEQDYLKAENRVVAYYILLDSLLEELWRDIRPPRLLAVVSPYGVNPVGGVERLWLNLLRRPALEGRHVPAPEGAFLLAGDGVEPGTFLDDTRLIDVVPTLLYGLGYPIARDLDGRVLTTAFQQSFVATHPLVFVPSYETLTPFEATGALSPAQTRSSTSD